MNPVPGTLGFVGGEERVFRLLLQKFDVSNHVFGGQDIVDQHEASQHLGNRCLLRSVHNAHMRDPGGVQSKKFRILRYDNTALLSRSLQVLLILNCL
jgi:hypothetical protein